MRYILASVMVMLAASLGAPHAHADVWTATFSGRMTLLDVRQSGEESVTYRWDPARVSVGIDNFVPVANGPLAGAEWHGLVNGSNPGGTLSARINAFFGSLVSDDAVAQLGVLSDESPVGFWADPVSLTRTLIMRGGPAELYGGVPGAHWGDDLVRPTFQQTATLTIAPVPEPGTAALLGSAALVLLGGRCSRFLRGAKSACRG